MTRRAAYAVVAAAAVVPRLVVLLHERGDILASFTEKSDRFARTFVDDGTFGFIPGEPSAWTQPLYSFFLVPIYWIAGREWWSVGFAQIVVAAATALVVYETGRRFLSPRAGLVAALVATLSPYLVWHDVHVNRELLDQLLAAVVVFLTLLVGERRGGPAAAALLGLALGLAILGNSRLVLLPLVIAGYLLWRRKGWQTVGVTLAACVVALLPWLVRNDVNVGCFTLTTDSRALWKANNLATYDVLDRGRWIDDVPNLRGRASVAGAGGRSDSPGQADDGGRVRADAALPAGGNRLLAGAPRREGALDGAGGADALGSALDSDRGASRGRRLRRRRPHVGTAGVHDPALRARRDRPRRHAQADRRALRRAAGVQHARSARVRGRDALPRAVGLRARARGRRCSRLAPRSAAKPPVREADRGRGLGEPGGSPSA